MPPWLITYPIHNPHTPHHLRRNVTVSGANGTNTVVDQQFQRARLQLCGSCTWTYRNITVANDNKGSAASNELFVAAELGARVILQDANVLRLACPSPSDTLGVLTITPRSSAFQDGLTQQKHSRRDIVVQVWWVWSQRGEENCLAVEECQAGNCSCLLDVS